MSKFWEASSDSEPDVSDHEGGDDGYSSEDGSGGEEGNQNEEQAIVFSDTDSEPDVDTKREVRSARVKRYDEMNKIIERIRENLKGNEWDKLWPEFQSLHEWVGKAKQIISEDGVPGPYVQVLCDVEDIINQTAQDKAALKALNKLKLKAFTAMKHKAPKLNKAYAADMERWRKDPSSFELPEEKIKEEKARKKAPAKKINWASESSEDEAPEQKPKPQAEETGKTGDWTTVTRPGTKATGARKGQLPPEKIEWNDTIVMEWLNDIKKRYGHKKTDTQAQIVSLKELLPHAKATQPKVEIYKQIIASMLGRTYSNMSKYMKRELWTDCVGQVRSLLKLITEDSDYHLAEGEETDESESLALSMRAFVEQLDTEFVKSLQNIDPHTHEYVERLRDEGILLDLAALVQQYYENLKDLRQAARMAMKRIEHIYYKLDSEREKLEEAHQGRKAEGEGQDVPKQEGNQPDLEQLCVLVYTHGDEVLRTRTMLCHVYHHALHDRYHQARDILLITHIQDTVQQMDVTTQILYNRALARLGLCAFKNGLISEAYSSLADLCSGKTREYLAQGVSTHTRYGEKNPEQEKLEKQRQVPYHMHLSLELLEAVHLISAMLLEVPQMAAHPFDKPKGLSRFRKLLDLFERQVYTGPPETTRDYVITAAKALSKGDWKRCEELLLHLPVWDLVQGVDQVKAMLRTKIQEAGLRTYLFTYSRHYNSLSVDTMCQMFDLPHATANSIIYKMMFNEELHASVDQPTRAIVMHKVEPSKLQYLALQYAERIGGYVENNELILDARTGCYGNKLDQAKPQKGDMRRKPYGRGGFRQKAYNPEQRNRNQGREQQGQQRRPWTNRPANKGDDYHQDQYKRYIQRRAV